MYDNVSGSWESFQTTGNIVVILIIPRYPVTDGEWTFAAPARTSPRASRARGAGLQVASEHVLHPAAHGPQLPGRGGLPGHRPRHRRRRRLRLGQPYPLRHRYVLSCASCFSSIVLRKKLKLPKKAPSCPRAEMRVKITKKSNSTIMSNNNNDNNNNNCNNYNTNKTNKHKQNKL